MSGDIVQDQALDPLDAPDTGARAIRGGSMRIVGYGVGVLLYLGTSPFLIRHLGVTDLGGYASVLALIGVVALLSDAGLTLVGVREYATRAQAERAGLLENLLALRLLIVAMGVAVAIGFAAVAGYGGALVAGTALAGVGLLLLVVQQAYAVAFTAELRVGTVTALEVGRQALTSFGLLALIAAGAGVTELLAVSVPVSCLIAVILWVRGPAVVPRIDPDEARHLIRETVPVAIASTIGSFFYRSALIVMSVTATAAQTSYFGASYRIFESVMAVPSLLCATVFPVLSRAAGGEDRRRTAFALRRLAEVGLILGAGGGLTLALAAAPVMSFLAGSEFRDAAAVLQIQAAALPATFCVSVWATGLWAVRSNRDLAIANAFGVALAVVLAAFAGPHGGAKLVAAAMLFAEWVLALLYLRALTRAVSGLAPSAAVVAKVVAASTAGIAPLLIDMPDLVRAALGALLFGAVVVVSRAVPEDVWRALAGFRATRRDRPR